jgi:hypothetical protein
MWADVTRMFLRTAVTVLLLIAIPATNLRAEDPGGKPQSQPKRPADTNPPRGGADDDDKLFKNLVGAAAKKQQSEDNLLERAIKGMRNAQRRIDENDSGAKTRQLQQRVVTDLEQLIKRWQEQQAKSRRGSVASNRPQTAEPNEQNPDPSKPAESKPNDGKQTSPDKSTESTDKPREAENRAMRNLVTPREMVRDVWGHLPPTVRQTVINAYSDTYLPKYDDLVRRYFSALAEAGRAKKQP